MQAVTDRLEELGKQGLITGDQVAEGMEKARKKIDDLVPGVTSLGEALHNFGLKSCEELQATAEKLRESWLRVSNDATVSIGDVRKAFDQYAAAATAANQGIEPYAVKVARVMLEIKEGAADAGKSIEDAMERGGRGADKLDKKLKIVSGRLDSISARNSQNFSILGSNKYGADGFALGADGQRLNITGQVELGEGETIDVDRCNRDTTSAVRGGSTGKLPNPKDYIIRDMGVAPGAADLNAIREKYGNVGAGRWSPFTSGPLPSAARAPAPATTKVTPSSVHQVNITLGGGKTTTVNTASDKDAQALIGFMAALESSARSAGGV